MKDYSIFTREEHKLLLLLSRTSFNDGEKQAIENIKWEEVAWAEFFAIAASNKILSLVWHHLDTLRYVHKMPYRLYQLGQFYYLGMKQRNKIFLEELGRVLQTMDSHGIRCIPLKGAYLIPCLYKDMGIRSLNDIDMLVRYADVKKIQECMKTLGYIEGDYDFNNHIVVPFSREKKMLWKMKMNNLCPFRKAHPSEYVQYITFDFSFSLDLELDKEPVNEMIARAEAKNDCYHLQSSDFFLHLCCHLYKEASDMRWIVGKKKDVHIIKFCDVREFIHHEMDAQTLDEAIARAKKYRIEKAVYFTLTYLKEIYEDGYEKGLLNTFDIKDNSFLNEFVEQDSGEKFTYHKTFFERLFSDAGIEEIADKNPEFLERYNKLKYI